MTRFERDKRAAIEAVVELLERIDKATVNMENAREEKDLVTFVYWFVLIHEYYYMLCEKPVPQRIAGSIYAEIESCSPIDYLKNKQKQRMRGSRISGFMVEATALKILLVVRYTIVMMRSSSLSPQT